MSKDLKELLASIVIITLLFCLIRLINWYCAKKIRVNKINRLLLSRATMRSVVMKAEKGYRQQEAILLSQMEMIAKSIFGGEVRFLLDEIKSAEELGDHITHARSQRRLDEIADSMATDRDIALDKLNQAYRFNVATPTKRIDEIEQELKELKYDPTEQLG